MTRLLLLLFLVLPSRNFGQDVNELLKQAGQLEAAFRENEAFLKYSEAVRLQPHNITALCKCSDLCCRIGNRQPSKAKKIDYFKAGRNYADAAYRLSPNNYETNIVMAFSIARMGLVEGGRQKIAAACEVKKYAENAVKIDPGNFKAYHILGKWHYEVSDLNIVEKALARWFCSDLPEASLDRSIAYYEKCRTLAPDFIARAYRRNGQKARAIQLLNQMMLLPDKMLDDARAKAEGRELLKSLSPSTARS
jgi:hypothetical protein